MPAERDTVTFDYGAPAELFMDVTTPAGLSPLCHRSGGDSFRSRGISRGACGWRFDAGRR